MNVNFGRQRTRSTHRVHRAISRNVAHRQRQILTSNKRNDLFRLFGSEGTIDELLEEVRSTAFIRSFVRTLTKPNAVQEPCVQ
jgi:hypothetical protein